MDWLLFDPPPPSDDKGTKSGIGWSGSFFSLTKRVLERWFLALFSTCLNPFSHWSFVAQNSPYVYVILVHINRHFVRSIGRTHEKGSNHEPTKSSSSYLWKVGSLFLIRFSALFASAPPLPVWPITTDTDALLDLSNPQIGNLCLINILNYSI